MSDTAGATSTAPDRTHWRRFHYRDSIAVRPPRRHAAAARCSEHILRHVLRFKQIYSTHTTTSGMKAHPHASPLPPALDKRGKKQTDVKMCCVDVTPPPTPYPAGSLQNVSVFNSIFGDFNEAPCGETKPKRSVTSYHKRLFVIVFFGFRCFFRRYLFSPSVRAVVPAMSPLQWGRPQRYCLC